ncbi:MAG: sigma-70 family RNA polymerase sigma factor [Chitinivibrionales bacterium]|nr:sigma-70 family RNA polymerase sigma factor [Chitinivibrionales bacterium]
MKMAASHFFHIEDDNLGLYLRDISKYKPLLPCQEYDLAVAIHSGASDALDELVKSNLRFVVSVARNYQNQGMSLVDLINEGNLGLIKAAKRFDEKKNFKFISYAVWWIRQAILQGLADHSRIVKVPLNRVATIHRVGKVRINLEQRFRRMPNTDEVAHEMGISEAEVSDSLQIGTNHTSLYAPMAEGQNSCLIDLMQDTKYGKTDDYALRKSQNRVINKLFKVLNDREKEVVRLYYGIDEDANYTLTEIGSRMNITRERVRQIKDMAIKKLKRSRRLRELTSATV